MPIDTANGLPADALHTFPAVTIGKHEWCLTVKPYISPLNGDQGERCTEYFWRRSPGDRWQRGRFWPRYDINNGMTLGMPASLRGYFETHETAIRHWLDHGRAPEQANAPQLELFC